MADELTADQIRALLKLERNATCGFVPTTYLSTRSIAAGGLPPPFADGRPMGSALYFMVTPSAPVQLHRIRSDQLYHHYLGIRSRFSSCGTMARRCAPRLARTCAAGSMCSS